MEQPSYFRARNAAIRYFISQGGESKDKSSSFELLKYGVIHHDIADKFEKYLTKLFDEYTFSELPLTFTELCSFNTWFAMYPEKIAGKEIITTSREFPIGIKGTKEDVIRVVGGTAPNLNNKNNQQTRIRIAKAKALAKIKLLKLI